VRIINFQEDISACFYPYRLRLDGCFGEVSDWESIGGVEKALISSSNSTGLQVKLVGVTSVVGTLPRGREGVRMNGILVVISHTAYRHRFKAGC
jgi:hypothetical protein